jgi:hypothetical protein
MTKGGYVCVIGKVLKKIPLFFVLLDLCLFHRLLICVLICGLGGFRFRQQYPRTNACVSVHKWDGTGTRTLI